jgi:hypothetical protein
MKEALLLRISNKISPNDVRRHIRNLVFIDAMNEYPAIF